MGLQKGHMANVEYASIMRKSADGKVVEVKPRQGSTKLLNLEGLNIDPLTDAKEGDAIRLISDFKGKIVRIEQI